MALRLDPLLALWGEPWGPLPDAAGCELIQAISTDSRAELAGALFVPLVGERFDGHRFLEAALTRAAAAVVQRDRIEPAVVQALAERLGRPIWPVDDTLLAYQQLARLWRLGLTAPVVAVTGSAGKTTTRELIRASLASLGPVVASSGNDNNDIGVPLTLSKAGESTAVLVVEMGMRGLGEIERLSRCAQPDLAVITNIGTAHIGRLGSREAIAQAKCEITAALRADGLVVIPAGDPLLERALAAVWSGRVRRVGLADELGGWDPALPAADLVGALEAWGGQAWSEPSEQPSDLSLDRIAERAVDPYTARTAGQQSVSRSDQPLDRASALTADLTAEPTAEAPADTTVEPTVEPTVESTVEPTVEPPAEANAGTATASPLTASPLTAPPAAAAPSARRQQLRLSDGTEIPLPLAGRHNARNLLLAVAVAQELGVPQQALTALEVAVPGGRSRRLRLGSIEVLDETYNASPEAMLASLALLAAEPADATLESAGQRRRYAVLGTMLELGDQSLALHRQVAERARELGLDGLVIVAAGDEGDAMLAGAAGMARLVRVQTPAQAAEPLVAWLAPGDLLLLKASRGVALEQLLPLLAAAVV